MKTTANVPRCCAEIGSVRRGWHECGRRASLESVRHIGMTVYYLYFCTRHARKAATPESRLICVSSVRPILCRGAPQPQHNSDLYVHVTAESRAILASYTCRACVTVFVDQITNTLWYDVPFAYSPFWGAGDKQ